MTCLDVLRRKLPFVLVTYKPFLIRTSPAFQVFLSAQEHKQGICKVLGRSVVFSAFLMHFECVQNAEMHRNGFAEFKEFLHWGGFGGGNNASL